MHFSFAIMCTIRSIYFYLLASGVLDDSSSSGVTYFLIEFPTMLYFTAFSSLTAFWVFLLTQKMNTTSVVLFLFNLLLYLMFVVLIILFQTLPTGGKQSECESRIPDENDNSRQHIVSVFYQSFMGGVAAILAIGILGFGGKLYLDLIQNAFEKKIAIVTLCCASGLILHCIFILYLSITSSDDFVLIVLLIVLSEIIPIGYIGIQFSLVRYIVKKFNLSGSYGSKVQSSAMVPSQGASSLHSTAGRSRASSIGNNGQAQQTQQHQQNRSPSVHMLEKSSSS
eukprot:TRINITY_DN4101_c0_g1_i3.p1 TRINITY_DN4101_c0_g1~~TRINITY_DN4101_c0_g1_i3.p1  ORF type:complete len:282 (-),score=55.58 TRINITY_DN4101_c0_g1_i3:727-1572(-)